MPEKIRSYLDKCLVNLLVIQTPVHSDALDIGGNKEKISFLFLHCSELRLEEELMDFNLHTRGQMTHIS